ncbi:hypothetical protein JZ751_020931 [Albula glossodonta]|uniref:Uncharacterized protein n=1 Tax=Albula glossodonta TaxID=121402 RepID=A0A8T2PNV3_9TELE|nr:hypothetical protein JZ751_020931 [Albula glossodonta]
MECSFVCKNKGCTIANDSSSSDTCNCIDIKESIVTPYRGPCKKFKIDSGTCPMDKCACVKQAIQDCNLVTVFSTCCKKLGKKCKFCRKKRKFQKCLLTTDISKISDSVKGKKLKYNKNSLADIRMALPSTDSIHGEEDDIDVLLPKEALAAALGDTDEEVKASILWFEEDLFLVKPLIKNIAKSSGSK